MPYVNMLKLYGILFLLALFLMSSRASANSIYHDLEECFDIGAINIVNPLFLYPYNKEQGKHIKSTKLNFIYFDRQNNTFYSDITRSTAPYPASLEKINNRCVFISGNRLERNQTDNLQIGLEIASTNNAYLYIEKNLYLNKTVNIKSNTTIIGIDSSSGKAQISPYLNSLSYMFIVNKWASNIEFRNLRIAEVREIENAFILFVGENESIRVKSTDFIWTNIHPWKTTKALLFVWDWAKNVLVRDSHFSGIENSIHFFTPIQDLKLFKNNFTQWSHYALLLNRSTRTEHRRSENIEIRHNNFYGAAAGGDRWVILISAGQDELFLKNLHITNNIFKWNKWSFIPKNLDPDYINNDAHGDQIVLHRVNEFIISHNQVYDGWENGITASRLSRNWVISNNFVYHNDGNGINIGSAYFELELNSTDNLSIWDRIRGEVTWSEWTITRIFPNINTIWIEKVNASPRNITWPTFTNEAIKVISTINNYTFNIRAVHRSKKIKILDNVIYWNGINSANEYPDTIFSWIYIINSDSIDMRRNSVFNTIWSQTQRWAITASRSRNLFADNSNIFENTAFNTSNYRPIVQIQSHSWFRNNLQP